MSKEEGILFELFGTKVRTDSVMYLVLIGLVGWWLLHLFFGTTIPGHWLEKGNYKTQMYVNVFPNDDLAKNYRLVGDIERITDCDSNDDGGSSCASGYYLHKVTFANEGYLEFDDCTVELHKKNYCVDTHDRGWDIELTDQKP